MFKKSVKVIVSGLMCLTILLGLNLSLGTVPIKVEAATNFAKGADIGW